MLLEYLVPSKARREVWKALRSAGEVLTVRALAASAGVAYSNVHREVLRMREVGLLQTEKVGNSLVCSWNTRNPAARKLTDLLELAEHGNSARPTEEVIYGSLKSWGAGLAKDTPPAKPLTLEETLAYGVDLARRDPDVAQAWPVVLAKNRTRVDLDRLETLVRRLGQKRALGLLLSLTGLLLADPTLTAFAARFRDSRVRETRDFFSLPRGKRAQSLAEANTPELARKWRFRMNTSVESLRSHFDKFVGKA
jgi:hypothetical protein